MKNLLYPLRSVAKPGNVIVDFCSGGGHLGLAAASLFPKCHVILVENKDESLNRARVRIKTGKVENVTLVQSNLTQWNSPFHIGLALHACGSATDQVKMLIKNQNNRADNKNEMLVKKRDFRLTKNPSFGQK